MAEEPLFKRLSQLFRNGPVVKRKIKDFRQPSASSALEFFAKSNRSGYSNIVSTYGQYDRLCVSLDELIPVPGPEKFISLKDLIQKYPNGEKFIVYAYDHENKRVTPAWAHHPRSSGIKQTVKITFDDGTNLICTPDHPCMLRDGTFRDAEKLISGDAMMPFYRKQFDGQKEEKEFKGYHSVYTMNKESKNGWVSEHKLIHSWINNDVDYDGFHVHHKDFNAENNNPENLIKIDAKEHLAMHGKNAKLLWEKPEFREKVVLGLKKAWDEDPERKEKLVAFNKSDKVKELRRIHAIEHNVTKDPIVREKISASAKKRFEDPLEREKMSSRVSDMYKDGTLKVNESFTKYWKGKKRTAEDRANRSGINHPASRLDITPESVKEKIRAVGVLKTKVAQNFGTSNHVLMRALGRHGITSWDDFVLSFQNEEDAKNNIEYKNHKVISVELFDYVEVGDLTVDTYENFATKSIFVHNCRYSDFAEMEYTPEICSAMDIYADETCSSDERGNMLHVFSENSRIKQILEELFFDTLNVNFTLRSWVRNLCKYGDFFMFIDVSPDYGVVNMFPIPVNEIEREEGFDPNNPLAHRFRWVTQGNQILEDWQVVHLRLLGNDAFLPYGTSIIEAARRIWRQLILIEDAMLVYRIVRSPERRVFYIDVGAIPPADVPTYLEEAKTRMRSNQVIDNASSRVDLRYNPLSVDEDYWIAVRGQNTGTKIDTLPGGQNSTAIEDVEYIQKKLFAALKIPKAFLGYDESLSSKATLSQEDIRFSRTISIIQKTVVAELNKLAIIHLYSHGFRDEDLLDFELKLSNPSTVAQQQKLELYRAKFDIMGSAPDGMLSRNFVRREIMGLTDDQIMKIEREKELDRLTDMKLESIKPPSEDTAAFAGGGGGGIPSGGSLFGSADDGDEIGGEEGAAGGEDALGGDLGGGGGGGGALGGGDLGDIGDIGDTGGEEGGDETTPTDEEEPEKEESDEDEERDLLTSDEDEGKEKQLNSSNPIPLKASNKVLSPYDRRKYNKGRRDDRHGPSKTGMPDLSGMLSTKADGMGNDPNDNEFLNRMSRESRKISGETLLDNKINSQMKKFDRMSKQTTDLISRLEQSDKFPKTTISKNSLLNEEKLSNEEDT